MFFEAFQFVQDKSIEWQIKENNSRMALFAQTVSNVNMMTLQVVTWIAHAQLTEQTSAGTCCLAQKTRDQHPLLLRTVLPLPHRCLVRELTLQSRLNHWQDAGAGLPDCALSLVTSAAVQLTSGAVQTPSEAVRWRDEPVTCARATTGRSTPHYKEIQV